MLSTKLRRRARAFTLSSMVVAGLGLSNASLAGTPSPPIDAEELLGYYSGTVQGAEDMCSDTADNGPFNLGVTVTLDQLGSAKGSFLTSDGDQGTISIDPDLGMNVNGSIVGRSPDGSTFDIFVSGTFYPDMGKLSLSGSGSGSDCGLILINSLVLNRTDNPAVNPANAPSNEVLIGQSAENTARGADQIARIAQARRTGSGNGMMRFGAQGALVQGKAAASDRMPIGAWAGFSRTSTDDDFVSTSFEDTRYDFLFGLDTQIMDGNGILGVAFGIQSSDVTTSFNRGTQDLTAITVAPYIGMLLGDWQGFDISFDGTVGYSDVSIDQTRTSVATGDIITSDLESQRYFAAANLTATRTFGSVVFSGLGGLTWASQRDDSFTESSGLRVGAERASVGRILLGAEAAYSAGAWEPYAGGTLEYDFSTTDDDFAAGVARPSGDDTGFLVRFGLRYFDASGISGAVEYSTLLSRDNLDEDTVMGNLRWEF